MIELYFLLYRIPRMMTRVAREQHRSAVAWSFIGIAAWLGAEIAVLVLIGLIYGFVALFLDWPLKIPVGLRFLSYLIALTAAIISVILVKKYLVSTSLHRSFPGPPPPPQF
jgi:hypothetical protein